MRLGLLMMPLHPPTRDYHQMLEEDLEAVVLADRLGFDDVWVGEHFSSMTEPVTSPLTFLADPRVDDAVVVRKTDARRGEVPARTRARRTAKDITSFQAPSGAPFFVSSSIGGWPRRQVFGLSRRKVLDATTL